MHTEEFFSFLKKREYLNRLMSEETKCEFSGSWSLSPVTIFLMIQSTVMTLTIIYVPASSEILSRARIVHSNSHTVFQLIIY